MAVESDQELQPCCPEILEEPGRRGRFQQEGTWDIHGPTVPGCPRKGPYCLCSQGQYHPKVWALLAQAVLVLLSGGNRGDGQFFVPSVHAKIEPILQCFAGPSHLLPYLQGMEADSGFADNKQGCREICKSKSQVLF